MRSLRACAMVSVLCLALVGFNALAADAPYTVGDFAVDLAKMITKNAEYTPEAAVTLLGGMGFELDGVVSAEVTEELLVQKAQAALTG